MFKLGIIEESLENPDTLKILKPFFFSQKIEEVEGDEFPIWHTNEYHVPDDKIVNLLPVLEQQVKKAWYAHAFNDDTLFVVFHKKYFRISPHKDETWDEMIEYGDTVGVERRFSESIPLSV